MLQTSSSPASRNRIERLRRGVALALLALFSQTVIALLPMPAMTAGAETRVLCGTASGQGSDAPHPAKAPVHSLPDCLACQAIHLATNLVPPAPVVFVAAMVPGWRAQPIAAASTARFVFQPQQARAPPSV